MAERVSDEMLNDAGIDLRKTGTPSMVKPKRRPAPASALTSPGGLAAVAEVHTADDGAGVQVLDEHGVRTRPVPAG